VEMVNVDGASIARSVVHSPLTTHNVYGCSRK